MGYEVEWRVIHADDYGFSQQRSRVFIMAYRTSSAGGAQKKLNGPGHFGLSGTGAKNLNPMQQWVFGDYSGSTREDWDVGPFGKAFPARFEVVKDKFIDWIQVERVDGEIAPRRILVKRPVDIIAK